MHAVDDRADPWPRACADGHGFVTAGLHADGHLRGGERLVRAAGLWASVCAGRSHVDLRGDQPGGLDGVDAHSAPLAHPFGIPHRYRVIRKRLKHLQTETILTYINM
ncbi:hypothetical protein SDC9_166049 [bioreactor metagenome]|uniref:Uncharacterized protein n=1 Tax=bioreactor metagenome TaxID=1076179 RepID=A0A645FXT5_9ZZZZ